MHHSIHRTPHLDPLIPYHTHQHLSAIPNLPTHLPLRYIQLTQHEAPERIRGFTLETQAKGGQCEAGESVPFPALRPCWTDQLVADDCTAPTVVLGHYECRRVKGHVQGKL